MYGEFIATVLERAAITAREMYGNVSSSVKPEDNNQVSTDADLAIGKMIVAAVLDAYPQDSVIDEEAGVIKGQSDIVWVVDPIDGTSNFAAGTPLYGCMLGVLKNGVPIAGGVTLPSLDQLYVAEKGLGATCNGKPIRVSGETELKKSLISYGIDGHQDTPELTYDETRLLAEIVLAIRNLRTSNSTFDLMMTARGSYGAFLNQTSKIWDNVAPQIIIEEAGGIYTDFDGRPMDYTDALSRSKENFTVCAAPPTLHAALQAIIRSVHAKSLQS